ncbi:hypothetical protein OEG82_11250 [Hoeflea sp. J2-29]|uniref:Uncharacterized protein n=1 Tax=Hoeflea ulvae TaxID=2983764 RepID=A0ABT3YFC3_9HYPH|nr:hypothetical protein [Hoeflea ulvae]MCY0094599.1 hypothetical protein [Hoeflea ulvae]
MAALTTSPAAIIASICSRTSGGYSGRQAHRETCFPNRPRWPISIAIDTGNFHETAGCPLAHIEFFFDPGQKVPVPDLLFHGEQIAVNSIVSGWPFAYVAEIVSRNQ